MCVCIWYWLICNLMMFNFFILIYSNVEVLEYWSIGVFTRLSR